jgi:CheY-like chemotaxis protein
VATILVVDDEFGIAEVLDAALTDAGHRVVTAMNGREGLRQLAEVTPDIVFLDVMMPVMNGPAMLREMQSTPAYRAIPVVLMSSLPEATVAALSNSYRAFLRKPFVLRSAIDVMGRILGTGRAG